MSTHDISLEEAAVLYVHALRGMGMLEAACIEQAPEGDPLPRGMLTCGEACILIPAVARLVLLLWPDLSDADVLESAFRAARTSTATGVPN